MFLSTSGYTTRSLAQTNWGISDRTYEEGVYFPLDSLTTIIPGAIAAGLNPIPKIEITSIATAITASVLHGVMVGLPRPYSTATLSL